MSQPTPGAVLRGAVDLSALRNRPTAPEKPAAGTSSAPAGLVRDVTDADFGDVLELSRTVPVVVDLWATWCGPCTQLSPILEKLVLELAGRLVLAKVDVDANPQLQQAFRAQSIPTVVALVGGQAVPLFTGAVPEQQVRDVFTQLLEVAARSGVSGTLPVQQTDVQADAAPAVPPLRAQAEAAVAEGDYSAAATAYQAALDQNPRDDDARVGLNRVHLLQRVEGVDAAAARTAAAASRSDVDAQLLVADVDLAGGHVDDAFARLLDVFAEADPDGRARVRERLLELFATVGEGDPRVGAARRRLTSLLF